MKVAAIDIGSSAIKGCRFTLHDLSTSRLDHVKSVKCPLERPTAGLAEHNLERCESAVIRLLDEIPVSTPIGFTSAMHALVLLDQKGKPLCDAIAWADLRSTEQARELKAEDSRAHTRTGTPLHPMAWPSKLLWVKQKRPVWWASLARVTDLKAYLLERLLGQPAPLDVSSASATGLWNQIEQQWDQRLMKRLGLESQLLPEVSLDPEAIRWKGRDLHLGGGDGPLGNLGVGAVTAERTAISLGTSGAVRQVEGEKGALSPALFRYAIDRSNYVRGGAISNGTSVLDWLQKLQPKPVHAILEEAKKAPPGAEGLTVFPYFSGERAPFWKPEVQSHIVGWAFQHDFSHLARACLEAVAFCLKRLLTELSPPSGPLRCTGGLFASPFWRQLAADVLGYPVAVSPVQEATAFGAAHMTVPNYLERSANLPYGDIVVPKDQETKRYEELYQRWWEMDPERE